MYVDTSMRESFKSKQTLLGPRESVAVLGDTNLSKFGRGQLFLQHLLDTDHLLLAFALGLCWLIVTAAG